MDEKLEELIGSLKNIKDSLDDLVFMSGKIVRAIKDIDTGGSDHSRYLIDISDSIDRLTESLNKKPD